MVKQAIKKKDIKEKKSLSSLKEKLGLGTKEAVKLEASNADKEMEWIRMPKAFQEATKLFGFPMGYVSTICGHSNTGKSTVVNHAIAAAQEMGLIPVIYDTENNFDWTYAMDLGVKAEPIWGDIEVEHVDEETGEVTVTTERQIITYDGDFIYYNNNILADRYGNMDYSQGKETSKKRKVAVIEDIVSSINELLNAQDEGEIDRGFLFIWDSVGSISSYKSYKSLSGNNMFDAGCIASAFGNILNSRIPSSRKMSSPYTNTMIFINKVWLDSTTAPMAQPSLSLKGGNAIYYGTRLLILLGGQLKAATKRLNATSGGNTYNYGIQTKIKVLKNQLPSPWNITYEGEIICTSHGMIQDSELASYKKTHISDMLKQLNEYQKDSGVVYKEEDIEFTEEEGE